MTTVCRGDFVTALFDGVSGFANLRTLRPIEQAFVPLGDRSTLDAFLQRHVDRDCYVGVAARLTPGDGSLANCGDLPALFADLDFKDIGEAEARRRLESIDLRPSVTVHSGGGFHAYWLLREPVDLQSEAAHAKALLRRLATYVGADLAAAEPARILRVPNTLNFKYQPPRPVLIERFDVDRRYNASEFDDWLPAEPTHASGVALALGDPIPEGRRNACLTSLAGSMRHRGMSEDAILAALRVENTQRCRPPLPDEELKGIARSVGRYSASPPRSSASPPLELTTLSELLAEPDAVVDWLVEDRLTIGGLALLAGKPKSGKSTAARDLALQVARGGSWLGFRCLQRPVIYVALEDRRADVKRHFRAMGATNEPLQFVFRDGAGDLVARLRAVAAELRPGLIIVDTLQRAIKTRDLNDYAEVTTKFTPILELARETGAAVLLVHHAGKSPRQDPLDSVLGSTALNGSVDNVFILRRTDQYRTLQSVQRVGPDLPETVLELAANGATRNAGTRREADEREVESAFVRALTSAPLSRPALLDSVEGRRSEKLRALKHLVEAGTITRSGTGKRNDPYTYAMASAGDGGSQVPVLYGEPATHTAPAAESRNEFTGIGSSHDEPPRVPPENGETPNGAHTLLFTPRSTRDERGQ